MKTIKSTVIYTVPHWNFCNVDRFDMDGTPSKQVCQFCDKTKAGPYCRLYNTQLDVASGQIKKLPQCCRATAGFKSEVNAVVETTAGPTIPPKDLMKQTITMYKKTVNDLVAQGYPRAMAEQAAEKYILK